MVQQAVRSRIEETNAEFGAAASRGDTAAVADLYTDDAILLPPNAEMFRGKQAIKGSLMGW
jgi:ketosteroid isomerase-like protein